MGLSATMIVTTEKVTPELLSGWGLQPMGSRGDLWAAYQNPEAQFCAIARPGEWTIIWDPHMALADHFAETTIALPGTWHVASAVSVTNFVDYRVYADGTMVRLLHTGADEDEHFDAGQGLIDESGFVFYQESADDPDTVYLEPDGDLMLQMLPAAVGAVPAGTDVFAVEGEYYSYGSAG